ncbi:MAG: esterase-like activity of phytase family protein [Burkholderiaceae bacterium]
MQPQDHRRGTTRRTLLAGAGAALLLGGAGCASPAQRGITSRQRLRLIGETRLPQRLAFKGTTVGGLSGLDYDPGADVWYVLSDDRSELQPARFYTLRLALGSDRIEPPELLDVVTLRQPDGSAFAGRTRSGNASPATGAEVPDPESIRFVPATRTLLWTSEGDARLGLDPFVREAELDGRHRRAFRLPGLFKMDPGRRSGPRDNLTFEGLALTPDGAGAWVAMEAALLQDGPVPAAGRPGGPCRFTLFDLDQGQAVRQIAYGPDAIPQPPSPAGAYADNGVSEILMLDAHRLLVLERAYMSGVGNSLRLYQIDTREASDTLALPALHSGNHRPAPKTLVADFSSLGLSRLDNTEGMTWGPRLPDGRRTLVVVSDDNFNPGQITQFAAFEFFD